MFIILKNRNTQLKNKTVQKDAIIEHLINQLVISNSNIFHTIKSSKRGYNIERESDDFNDVKSSKISEIQRNFITKLLCQKNNWNYHGRFNDQWY